MLIVNSVVTAHFRLFALPFLKHKILLDDYKVRPELNKHKNI